MSAAEESAEPANAPRLQRNAIRDTICVTVLRKNVVLDCPWS